MLLSAKKQCTGSVSHAILCGKTVQTLNCILDEAEPSFGQNGLACQLLLSNAVSSDTLPSSANWEGFPHGFDLQHPVCFSAPSQCNMRSPHLDLNNFLHGISVGEVQLHNGGSSPRRKAQASSPCASFGLASLGISSDAQVEIWAERWGGTHRLGTANLLNGFHALAGIDPFLKATRDGHGKAPLFRQ